MSRGWRCPRGLLLVLPVVALAWTGDPAGPPVGSDATAAATAPGTASATEGEPEGAGEGSLAAWFSRWAVHGRWRLQARHRRAGDEADTDLRGVASLDVALPFGSGDGAEGESGKKPSATPEIKAHFGGAFDLDLDTFERSPFRQGPSGASFADLSNTYGSRFHANLTSAWVQARSGDRAVQGRVGRQSLAEAGGFLFDGARVDLRPAGSTRFRWTVEAGIPVHLYESSPAGDILAGTQGRVRILETVDASAGYVYVRDRGAFVGQEGDHHVFGKLRWRPDRSWSVQVGASAIDLDAFRETVDLGWIAADARKSVRLSVTHQDPLDQPYTTEFSPFLSTLGRLAPYVQARLQGEAEVSRGVRFSGGVSARQLVEGAAESTFNRDYRNAFLEATLDDRLWEGFGATLRGDYWDSGRGNIGTTGFEVRQRFGETTDLRAGTTFSLYRVDLFRGIERQQDRIWFLELDRSVGDTFRVGLRYAFENDELDDTQTLVALVTQSF